MSLSSSISLLFNPIDLLLLNILQYNQFSNYMNTTIYILDQGRVRPIPRPGEKDKGCRYNVEPTPGGCDDYDLRESVKELEYYGVEKTRSQAEIDSRYSTAYWNNSSASF